MIIVIEIGDNQYAHLTRGGVLPIVKDYVRAVLDKKEAESIGVRPHK